MIYDKTRNDIFSGYIHKWYGMKSEEDLKPENEINHARRNICKIMMNALYGKMLQRASFESEIICNSVDEIYKFLKNKKFIDLDILGNGKVMIKAETDEEYEDHDINKPSQLGSFILSYSRRIMLQYNKAIDPTLEGLTNVSYSDTDSLHVQGHIMKKLEKKNLIRSGELGYMTNDYKKGGLILMEKNLGSKMYMNKYIDKTGKITTVMKAKGLPKKSLTQKFFFQERGEVTIKNSFKKVFNKITTQEKEKDIGIFTIRKEDMTRAFNLNRWKGRVLGDDGIFYCIGYRMPDGYVVMG